MLNNFVENGGFNNNHGQTARSTEAQKPQSWGYNTQLEGMYYAGEQHQPMYMGTYGSGTKHPTYSQYPTSTLHQPVATPAVVKCMEACCQHYPINPAPLRYHQTNTDTRQYRTMQAAIPRKKLYPTENSYPGHYPQYIGRGPALNVADSRQQMPMIRPQYPVYPPGYWENRSWMGPRMNCPPSYHQSVNQSAQLQTGLKIPDGSHYVDPNAQKMPSSQHRRVGSGSGGTEIIRPIPEQKRQVLDHNPNQNCYEYGYPSGFLPFNDVNKIQNGNLACQNNNGSYKIASDKPYHPHQMQYAIQHNERNLMNPNSMYDLNYPMNYPLPSGNDAHLRPEAEDNHHLSDTRKYDSSLSKKRPDLDLRQYLATWDDDEDEGTRVSDPLPVTNTVAPYIVVDNRSFETDASGKQQERLNLKPEDSPAKSKDNSPICEQSAEEQPLQNNDAGRAEVLQTSYAPSMPTLLSDLDKNTTPWNGMGREGEGVIGKSGAFQPLDCSKRDMSFDNQKQDMHSENPLHKLPAHDPSNLSFDHLAPYYNETRRLDSYNSAEAGNRILKNSDTTTSNYHHIQPQTNLSRPCDPRLQHSQGNNSSIYSKVTPKCPSTNNYDLLKPTDGYYNYKHSMPSSKYFSYENPIDSNYDYNKYISDLDNGRLFENQDSSKDPRRMYPQEMGKAMNVPFIEPYNKTADSNSILDSSNYGLNATRPESFIDPNVKDNGSNHQPSPFLAKINSPGDGIITSRNETQSFQEKSVLVSSKSGSAKIVTMPFSPEKEISQKDNVVTLHSTDQAKDNAITVEVPYDQQYSTLVRLSEEISQTESTTSERAGVKSVDSNSKLLSNEELKKPTSLKIKRLPNSEEWTVEENSSNLAPSKQSTDSFGPQSNESSEKVDMLKMSVNVGSLNMPSLDDIRDGEESSEILGQNLTNKFMEGIVCSNKTTNLEDVIKTKHTVQVPQMAIVQPMKVLEPELKCLVPNSINKHDDETEKEISFKRSYSTSYDLNQNNFSDKLLLNDLHHGKQTTFSKHEVSKHENFRTHKKIQRSLSDCFSSCLTDQRDGFIRSEGKLSSQSYSDCEVNSNLRGYFKIDEENATEENTRMPSSPGVDGMFEDINNSSKDLLNQRKSCDYQEASSHELTSLNSDNHFQSFSNMFIDDMNRRERSDGSVLQMSDRKCLKPQVDDTRHQDLSKSFEEHVKRFKSHSETRIATSEKSALSKKSPPIPPINLKLIESKKIWCITNKEQHVNQSNCLYENALENVGMCLDLNHIETDQLENNSKITEEQFNDSLHKERGKGSLVSIKANEDGGNGEIGEHPIESLLNEHDENKLSSVRKATSVSETLELSVSSHFPSDLRENFHNHMKDFNSTSDQSKNKCLSIVKYYPRNKLFCINNASIEKDECMKIFIFDEKGNHFPKAPDKVQEQRTESEAVVFDILNDILTKSLFISRSKVNIEHSSNDFSSNKTENHSKSVIKFDSSYYNKKTEKLTDPIAKTTERFIQHEKENCQHYSVIKVTHLEVANCIDLQKSSMRSIFSPMPDDDKGREEYLAQSSCSQIGKVKIPSYQINEVTQMDLDTFGHFDGASDSQMLENSQDNRDASKVSNATSTNNNIDTITHDKPSTREPLLSPIKLLSNTEEQLIPKRICGHVLVLDELDKDNHSEMLALQTEAENFQSRNEQSSLISTNLPPDCKRDTVVVNQVNKMEVEEENLSASKNVLSPILELFQVRNPLDNDLALSPESSSSESTESDFSDDYKSPKDDDKHQTDCSSGEDEVMDCDDILEEKNLVHSEDKLKHSDLFPLSCPPKRDIIQAEDRSQTSVIVRNKTCNSVLLDDDQDYRSCFDCIDSAMPIDCSMKSTRRKTDESHSKIRIGNVKQQNSIYCRTFFADRSVKGQISNHKNHNSKNENLGAESNLRCEDSQISEEKRELSLKSDHVSSKGSSLDTAFIHTKINNCGSDFENSTIKIQDKSKDKNKTVYCTNESFFCGLEEKTTLKMDHPSYMHLFKKRKWQKFFRILDKPDIVSNKPNTSSLERNFSIINFGTNCEFYPMKNLSEDLIPVENQPIQLNANDTIHNKPNLNLTLNEDETLNATNFSSENSFEPLKNEENISGEDDISKANVDKEDNLKSNVSGNNHLIKEKVSNSECSSDSEMESSSPLDLFPPSLSSNQISSVSKPPGLGDMLPETCSLVTEANTFVNKEDEILFQKEHSHCESVSQQFDFDISNELSKSLPVEANNSLEEEMSENSAFSDSEVNCQSANNEITEVAIESELNLNENFDETDEQKNYNVNKKEENIPITEYKNDNPILSLFSSYSSDLNGKYDENTKLSSYNKSTNESLHSWNDSDSSVSFEDSQINKESVDFVLPKTESTVFAQPLAETNIDEELIRSPIHNSETNIESLTECNSDEILTSTSNNNNEVLNDSFSKISNFSQSTEICQEPNIEPSEDMTSSIVTGKDVLFSSRFLHDEEEQFSNSELGATIKNRTEEDDDDHDARTDAIKESLRNNQALSTETFPLQCLVEAALALENVDSKQMMLNTTPLADGYCQNGDRFLKLPGTEILPNCFDEPSDEEKAVFNEQLLPINQTENALTLSDKDVFTKFEETNYNLRASTRIVTSSSSNIPYSKRKYCFKSKLIKNKSETKPKSQKQIKEKNHPKKRKGFFSYPRSKRRKRITKDKKKSIPIPLQEIFDDNSSEINSEKEIARETSEEKLGSEKKFPDQNVKVHPKSYSEDKAANFSMENPTLLPYFSKNDCKNDFGGPLIIASKGNSSSEANILCVQVDTPKVDSFSHDLNEELESISQSQSLFKDDKTMIDSEMSSVALGSSTSLVIIIEDLENITENKSSFEDQSKRNSDFIFGSVEDCAMSKNNTEDCSTILTTEMSINESCICPPHYSLDEICENGLHKEKANELMDSEHFISNTFINIEDTSFRKYSSCSNSDLLATNCYEEINEDDISNWPFVEEEVAEFESNPDPSNMIPENGRKIELKCSLPWKKIFNISKTKKTKTKTSRKLSGLELGPANVEVRLKAPSSEWKVIGDFNETSSPVVKVSRLILQRESETSSFSEKDSEEENENKIQQNSHVGLQDENVCNHSLVKDVIHDEQWQPVVLLTRNKILDELNLSLDSKSSGKELFSPHNMSTNDSENYEERLKELQSSLKEVQNKQNFSYFTKDTTLSFSSDDSFVKTSSDNSSDFNDCQGRKVKLSSYGTYSPSADNNDSVNEILYSPSDPHFSPEHGVPYSNQSSLSKNSSVNNASSCVDDIFEENYENTRLSFYFTDAFDKSDPEARVSKASDKEKHSFLNETFDNTRSGFIKNSTQEICRTSFKVQTCFPSNFSARNKFKENKNLKDNNIEIPNPKIKNVEPNKPNYSNKSKDTTCSRKMSCANSIKIRRKMPKNFFVRKKIRKNKDAENADESSVFKAGSDEVTLSDVMQNKPNDKREYQETCLLASAVGLSIRENCRDNQKSYDRPANNPSSECEISRLQCIYDLDDPTPASQHDFPPSERFAENQQRGSGRGLKRPCEGHSKEDTKRRRKQSRSRSSCFECELHFENKEELSRHNSSKHDSRKRELHHCLLCQRTFASYRRHRLHIQGRSHRHLELTQRQAALAMYRRLTGRECPLLPPLSLSEQRVLQWRPTRAGYSHFYHAPTPLQALLQEQSSGTTEETRVAEEGLPND